MSAPTFELSDPTAPDDLVAGAEPIARTQWQLFRRRFFRHRAAVISLGVLLLLIVVCFGAPWIAPYPHNVPNLLANAYGPSAKHWFGVDDLGKGRSAIGEAAVDGAPVAGEMLGDALDAAVA